MKLNSLPGILVVVSALAALCCHTVAHGQAPEPYQAMGAPSDPRVEVRWNRYHDYAASTEILQKLAEAYPDLCRLESLGKSYGEREMWVLTISNSATGTPSEQKPAFWIDGGIHANEIQTVEVVLYTAWFLLESYGRSDFVTRLLDERTFYLMPMMSPDSRDAHFYEPNTTHSPRSGQRPVDDDRDGLINEDAPDDLDGDGSITQMRVADPNGRYIPHPDYPNLMIQAKPDEPGQYTLLGSEGIDNDGDGRVNEDGDGYYDPNRDWPWLWQPEYVQSGAHHYPFSVLENRMVGDFIAAHPNIAGAQSYHNAGGMLLRGPGAKEDRYASADVAVYDAIGRRGEEILPGYKYMNIANDLYEVYGGQIDWLYAMQGAFTFTNEMFTAFNYFRRPSEEGFFGRQEDLHAFNQFLLFGDGFVDWHEVDHPQYGKIEVGGFRKEWVRQPPSFLLEEECHRNMAFTLYHANQLALAEIQSVTVKSLGDDNLWEVTAVVANPKLAPTRAAVDVEHHISPPDRVQVSGGDAEVLLGLIATDRFFNQSREQKRRPESLEIGSIPSQGAARVRWIVRGRGSVQVKVLTAKAGTASVMVELTESAPREMLTAPTE